jgi:Variant SH3 domain
VVVLLNTTLNWYLFAVQILRGRDPDGFYLGEANGRRGLVPSNMVSEVDENTAAAGGAGGVGGGGGNRPMANHVGSNRQADLGADQSAIAARSRKDVTPPSPRRHHKHSGNQIYTACFILAVVVNAAAVVAIVKHIMLGVEQT